MTRLVRPHIPLDVRVRVIARQLQEAGRLQDVLDALVYHSTGGDGERLDFLLECMFGFEGVHLDHDPPLMLREIINAERGIYKPGANDPQFLIYRTAEQHRLKTFVRGDGAQLSDAGKRRKEIRRRRKEEHPRPSRWPPKGSRPLQWKPR